MPKWGIGFDYGFYRPNNSEITEDLQTDMRNTFGGGLNIGDNSRAGMLIKVQANREFRMWQQLEAVYNSQTKNGAEGEFLDEMYQYQGEVRKGASFGTGNAIVETNKDAIDITPIIAGTTFNAIKGLQYISETARNVGDFVRGYKIDADTLQAGAYTFTITNSNSITKNETIILANNTDGGRNDFFHLVKVLFEQALPEETAIIHEPTSGDTAFYVGFSGNVNEGYFLTGTEEIFKLKFQQNGGVLRIGNRYSEISTIASTKGYNPLASNEITSMLPTPQGFVSATNIKDFFSGSDVETDASFSVRVEQQADSPNSGTRPAIIAKVLAIPEVVGFSLNKTVDVFTGRVEVRPIVFGGASAKDIATALYLSQGINNQFFGSETYTVQTEDGKTEDIQFSYGTDLKMDLRVLYKPQNGIPLATTEQTAIKVSLENVNSVLTVGGTVFNGQLAGAVFDTNPVRFTEMSVSIRVTSSGNPYLTDNYIPLSDELPTLDQSRIEIIQDLS